MQSSRSSFQEESVSVATRPAHIVLAESDSETRRLVASALRKDGHDVIVARCWDELVEHLGSLYLEHKLPDAIIFDAEMPHAIDTLASIRENGWCRTPLIVITRRGYRRRDEEVLLEPVAALEEPLNLTELRDTVRNVLEARSWERLAS